MSRMALFSALVALVALVTSATTTFAQRTPEVPGDAAALSAAADEFLASLDGETLRDPAIARTADDLRASLKTRGRGGQGADAAILRHMNLLGDLVARTRQPQEQFGIRVEDELGTARCHEDGIADGIEACADNEWLSTRSPNFVNIKGDVVWRGSRLAPQGRQMTASFVATQDDTNTAITFSAEAYVKDDLAGTNRRMFIQALVDGKPIDPDDVVFAVTEHRGVRSFVFTTNVDAGIHTVEIRWRVDERATAYMRDASLLVRTGRHFPSNHGTLAIVTPDSGANQETTSSNWSNVLSLAGFTYVGAGGQLTATVSAESAVSNDKRIGLRALVDGAPLSPSNVVFAKGASPQSRSMTFGATGLTPGWHFVTVQWQVENGGMATLGDRSLVLASYPTATHPFIAAPGGESIETQTAGLEPMAGMNATVTIPAESNGEVAVQLSAEAGTTNDGEAYAVLAVDGEILTDGLVLLTDGIHGAQAKSWVFEAKGLEAGDHELEIWWGPGNGGDAYIGDRTLAVLSETGFVPDLAEAPQFAGGHVNWSGDYIAGIEPLIGTRNVLAILWDPGLCGDLGSVVAEPPPPVDENCKTKDDVPKGKVQAALFGNGGTPGGLVQFEPYNVQSYFSAMSGGRFTIAKGGPGVTGYYDAQFGAGLYYDHPGGCTYGFDNGGDLLIAEAVSLSNPDINYAQFDTNADGELDSQELAIIVVIPREDGDGSSLANLYSATCPDRQPMVLDGVEMPLYVAKWNTSLDESIEPYQFTTAAHELLHVISLLDDNYGGTDWATYPRSMNLMSSNRFTTTYLDPMHRLALGWVTPKLVTGDGLLQVEATEQSDTVYILPRYNNPYGEEYFIVESRQEGLGLPYYDDSILDSGIAVWHIVSDTEQITNAPMGVPDDAWAQLNVDPGRPGSVGQMARKGIRLIRPFDDIQGDAAVFADVDETLWHEGKYDIESGACFQIIPNDDTFQNKLAWADCTASGYSLDFQSWPGALMNVEVTVD